MNSSTGKPEGCPTVTVVICTLNEAQNLPHVLPKIPQWVDEILLVDGHSTDDTVAVAKNLPSWHKGCYPTRYRKRGCPEVWF